MKRLLNRLVLAGMAKQPYWRGIMQTFSLVLLAFAFVFFTIAALAGPPLDAYRTKLIAAGLAVWVAAELFGGIGKIFISH